MQAIRSHIVRGEITAGLVFEHALRLTEIGEANADLPPELPAIEPNLPWQDMARLRDQLTHGHFDTSHSIVAATVANDLPLLEAAVSRLVERLPHS